MSEHNEADWMWLYLDALIAQHRSARSRLPPFPEPLTGDPDAADRGYQTWTPEDQWREFRDTR